VKSRATRQTSPPPKATRTGQLLPRRGRGSTFDAVCPRHVRYGFCQRQHGLQMVETWLAVNGGMVSSLSSIVRSRTGKPCLRGAAKLLQAALHGSSGGEHHEFHGMISPGVESSIQWHAACAYQDASSFVVAKFFGIRKRLSVAGTRI